MEASNHNGYTIISLGKNENRFNPTFISTMNNLLDKIDVNVSKGIVFTGEGKYVLMK
jgi:hypothetical protein